jgi:RNA polymerase sigma factor (sigma-70 family)
MAEKVPFDFNGTLRRLSGDEQVAQVAFKELHDYFGSILYVKARRFMKSQPMAEDLVQEVFTAIWIQRKQLAHIRDLEVYLYGMTKRKAFDLTRRSLNAEIIKRKHLEIMEVHEYDPLREKYATQLEELIELLPPPRKQIFKLAKIEGVDGKAIAERFQISVDLVYQHLTRATKFINQRKHDVTSWLLVGIAFIQRLTGL